MYILCRDLLLRSVDLTEVEIKHILRTILWTPNILCGVCTSWKAFCRNTPSFWSRISVPFLGGYFPHLRDCIVDNTRRHLLYSRRNLLRVSFYSFRYTTESWLDRSSRALVTKEIWNHSNRWTTLRMLQDPRYIATCWETVECEPKNLLLIHITQSLLLTWKTSNISSWRSVSRFVMDVQPHHRHKFPLRYMPSLVRVEFYLYQNDSIGYIGRCTFNYVLSLAAGSSSLRYLRIRIQDNIPGKNNELPPEERYIERNFVFPGLEVLTIEGYDPQGPSLQPHIRCIEARGLQRLRVDHPYSTNTTTLLQGCRIRSLYITSAAKKPVFLLDSDLVSAAHWTTSLTVCAYADVDCAGVLNQLHDPDVLPSLSKIAFIVHKVKRHTGSPDRMHMTRAFSTASALWKLLILRPNIKDITAVVSCLKKNTKILRALMNQIEVKYKMWVLTEDNQIVVLQNHSACS